MDEYKVLIEGFRAQNITNEIVRVVIDSMDLDKLKNEVKNKIVHELKGDIINSQQISNAVKNSIDKADKIVTNRVNEAITRKIDEISKLEIGTFKLVKE